MPLVLAIKNREAIVVASDADSATDITKTHFNQIMPLSSHAVLLMAGNLEAVRHAVMNVTLPKLTTSSSAAEAAQIMRAALVLDVVPRLAEIPGRVEIIVAGIDPIRHIEEPGLYYMDSAQNFTLSLVPGDAVAAGSTAAVSSLLAGHSFAESSTSQLQVLAKECLSATKLRWPTALQSHIRLGVITPQTMRFQDF